MSTIGEFETLLCKNEREYHQIRVYQKRWLMLFLGFLYFISNSMQYAQYAIIANLAAKYYNVSYTAINWTVIIVTIIYILFSLPGGYILNKLGLRISVLIGVAGTTIGAWVKLAAVEPKLFWLAFTGQTIVSIFQVLILPVPARLAGVWFSNNEVATACGIGIMGVQVGNGLGFLLPSLTVNNGTIEEIGKGIYTNSIIIATFCTITGVLLFYFFEDAPEKPPSISKARAIENKDLQSTFCKSISNLASNKSYVIFVIIMAIGVTSSIPILVMINEVVLSYYPDTAVKAGVLGALFLTFSILGSFASGIILDKFRNYRDLTLYSLICNLLTVICVTLLASQGLWILFILIPLFGFIRGFLTTISYETGVELTYPESEELSGTFFSTTSQLSAALLMGLFSISYTNFGFVWANSVICFIVFITSLLFFCVEFNLRRQMEQTLLVL